MCWLCDHPGASYDNYLDYLRGKIARHGWAVQGVQGDRTHPPWAYTIGLTPHGRPELVVTAMRPVQAAQLLNKVAAHVLRDGPPRPGERLTMPGGGLIEIVSVAVPSAHLTFAANLYDTELEALQLVHADDRGHWPWERGWRGIRGGQPVLGERAAPGSREAG